MCLFQLSSAGDVDVNVNMQKVLSEYNGPKDLNSLLGKYLYIAVLVEESTGEHGSLLLARVFEILKYLLCILSVRWYYSGDRVCCSEVCQVSLQPEPGVHAPLPQTWTAL